MTDMKTSLKGKIEIMGHEAIGLSKYLDSVGVWTIGAGATRSEIPDLAKWSLDKTITVKESVELFERGLPKYEKAINRVLKQEIPQPAFDALVSWAYNVGGGYASTSTIMRIINSFKVWQALAKVSGVVNRGDDEAKIVGKNYSDAVIKRLMPPAGDYTRDGNTIYASELWHALMMYLKPIEITKRRHKEARLLVTGEYSNDGKVMLFPVSVSGYPQYGKGKLVNVEDYLI